MPRAFSVNTVLRQTPNRYLRHFFPAMPCGDLGVPWDELREHDIGPMVTALHALPRPAYDAVEAQLHDIFDLACATGTGALIEALACYGHPAPAEVLPQDVNAYGRAMWAWLYHREAFSFASRVFQVEHFTWWRKRNDLPAREPDTTREGVGRLAGEISRIFVQAQGRGRCCTVEVFRRREVVYFFAHPDDHVQSVAAHDEHGALVPRPFRRTFLVVYAYNRAEGSLELFAQGPGPLKGRLEVVFAKAVLGAALGPWNRRPTYELGHLLSPDFVLATDPADGVRARIRRMRLHLKNSGRRVTLEADPDAGPEDIYRMMGEVLDQRRVPPPSVFVGMVTLTFEFDATEGRRGGSMTFDVAYPHSCGLRNHRPEHVEVALKYLRQWGIDGGGRPATTAAAVGP
jgi:hypothetical protein